LLGVSLVGKRLLLALRRIRVTITSEDYCLSSILKHDPVGSAIVVDPQVGCCYSRCGKERQANMNNRPLTECIKGAGIALITICLSATFAQLGLAQSKDTQQPDLQQMQNKLEQMEKEMLELKQQISSMQQPQKPATAPTKSEEAVAEVVNQEASAHTPVEEVGNPPLPAEHGTTLDLYGFVMLDSGYDFKTNNPDWFDVERPTKLNAFLGEFGPDGKVYFGVRQTRFGVKTSTETPLGDLTTRFEFELYGTGVDAGQTTFRLRHAYGELGAFGAGQTWSPFMDIDVFPNTIEYWGPSGMVFYRNVQVRWMPLRGDRVKVTFAAERPGATADQGSYSDFIALQDVRPRFNVPDISGNVRFIGEKGYLQVAGIFRKISWVDTNPAPPDLGRTVYGGGVNVSSNLKLDSKDLGKFQVVYGEGIENYMNDAPVDVGIQKTGNPANPIKGIALPVLGVVAFIDHTWSTRFSSSAGYSLVNIENANGDLPSAFHQGHYAVGNLLFYPVKQLMVGTEFQFGRRVNFDDGFNTNDYRLQFSVRYDWAKAFGFDR